MANAEIVAYVSQRLQQGAERQAITRELLAQGWSSQDVNDAFVAAQPASSVSGTGDMAVAESKAWAKVIPRLNYVFAAIYLLLVFGLDLSIIISDNSLIGFWYIMLGVLAAFFIFLGLENFLFKKKFSPYHSKLDLWISILILGRNTLFLLNFIPFIQLLGLMGLYTAGGPILLAYIILIVIRYVNAKHAVSPALPVS